MKKLLSLFIIFGVLGLGIFTEPAYADTIVFDATASGNASATSVTYSHTCTGSNLGLMVGVSSVTGPGSTYPTGVTYNGVSMTEIAGTRGAQGNTATTLFYLLAPATGAHNVVVTFAASAQIVSHSISWTGVKQSGQPDASNGNHGNAGTDSNVTFTTVASNAVMFAFTSQESNSQSVTANSPMTQRVQLTTYTNQYTCSGDYIKASPGSQNLGFDTGFFNNWAISAASFAPATSGSNTGFFKLLRTR